MWSGRSGGRYDALIIGAGQAGPPLAGRLTDAGKRIAIVERKFLGGTCTNTGARRSRRLSQAPMPPIWRGVRENVSIAF
jgi:pyruvate/2-oxoglutarate dehydrogenase complex dihydrolipoamide dehydrogenase (E3) component